MRRRRLLAAAPLALGGCLGTLPGPTGPRNPPEETPDDGRNEGPDGDGGEEEPLAFEDFEFVERDDGQLRVVVIVANRTDEEREATVRGEVETGEGDEESTFAETVEVTVPAGGEARAVLDYAIPYDEFSENGSFRPSFE